MIKLVPVTENALPFCRILYNEVLAEGLLSLLEPAELSFDAAINRPDSIFKLIIQSGSYTDKQGDTLPRTEVVGLIGLEKIRWVDRVAQTMVCVAPEFRENGIAYEASKILLKDLTSKYNLRRVVAAVNQDSPAAMVLQKLGFIKEGTLRQERFVDGSYLNGEIYGWIKGYDEKKE